jgi:hypothetical protein
MHIRSGPTIASQFPKAMASQSLQATAGQASHEAGFKQCEDSHDAPSSHHDDYHINYCGGFPLVHLNNMPAGPWWKEHCVKSTDTLQVRPRAPTQFLRSQCLLIATTLLRYLSPPHYSRHRRVLNISFWALTDKKSSI